MVVRVIRRHRVLHSKHQLYHTVYIANITLFCRDHRNIHPIKREQRRAVTVPCLFHHAFNGIVCWYLGFYSRKTRDHLGTAAMNDIRVHLLVTGRVQGVGFRYFAYSWAERLGLTGWVRNNYDGSVESEVEGDRSAVEEYITQFKLGPGWGRVTDVKVEYKPYEGLYTRFDITR